jgi:hypothetical protein
MRISFTTLPGTEVDVKNVIIRQDSTKTLSLTVGLSERIG